MARIHPERRLEDGLCFVVALLSLVQIPSKLPYNVLVLRAIGSGSLMGLERGLWPAEKREWLPAKQPLLRPRHGP